MKSSVRGRQISVVDQIIERLLHVDIGLDDAGLLKRNPRRQDRFALRRTDPVMGNFGAFLELLVDDGIGQLGRGDELAFSSS